MIDDMYHAYVHFKTVNHTVAMPVANLKTVKQWGPELTPQELLPNLQLSP